MFERELTKNALVDAGVPLVKVIKRSDVELGNEFV